MTETPTRTGTAGRSDTDLTPRVTPKPVPAAGGKGTRGGGRRSLPGRLSLFLREVVAELRKVIWPSRRELITYTTVVLVFVSFMVAIVAGVDIVFAKAVLAVFS